MRSPPPDYLIRGREGARSGDIMRGLFILDLRCFLTGLNVPQFVEHSFIVELYIALHLPLLFRYPIVDF